MNEILLNSVDLRITQTKFRLKNSSFILHGLVEYDQVNEQARIKFNQTVNVREILI